MGESIQGTAPACPGRHRGARARRRAPAAVQVVDV